MANIWGNNGKSDRLYFLGLQNYYTRLQPWIKRCLLLGRKAMTNLDSILKNRHYFAYKVPSGQSYAFSSSHVWMWELDYKESWAPKNWYFWTVVLEKTLDIPLDSKEIKPVSPKGNQPGIFILRSNATAEAPILWLPDAKSWCTQKDSDAGKDWGYVEKGITERRWYGITDSMDMSLSKFLDILKDKEAWHATVHGVTKIQSWVSD